MAKSPTERLQQIACLIDSVISEFALSPSESRLSTSREDNISWGLQKGSAQVFLNLSLDADAESMPVLHIHAPLLKLPADQQQQSALFRFLLELNVDEIVGPCFGLRADTVLLSIKRRADVLDAEAIKQLLLRLGYYADRFDDLLVERFGGQRFSD